MAIQINQQTQEFSTTAQINIEDLAEIAQLGFKTIINNRPDNEGGETQPKSADIEAAAKKLGLAYVHIPVIPNNIQPAQVAAYAQAYAASPKPVLGFCRTGNRAANICNMALAQPAPQGILSWLKSQCLITRFVRWCRGGSSSEGCSSGGCGCKK